MSERGYPSAPIRAVLCRILGRGDTLRRERPLGWSHATFKAALTEWIKKETFTKANGSYIVDESGVVRPGYRYWNLRELCHCEVRRILLLRGWMNKGLSGLPTHGRH